MSELCYLGSKGYENMDRSSEETAAVGWLAPDSLDHVSCPINLEVLSCFQFSSFPIVPARALEPNKETLSPWIALILVSVSFLSGLLEAAHPCCLHTSFATIICIFMLLWWCPCPHGHVLPPEGFGHVAPGWQQPLAVLPCRAVPVCSVAESDCSQMSLGGCVPDQVAPFCWLGVYFLHFPDSLKSKSAAVEQGAQW